MASKESIAAQAIKARKAQRAKDATPSMGNKSANPGALAPSAPASTPLREGASTNTSFVADYKPAGAPAPVEAPLNSTQRIQNLAENAQYDAKQGTQTQAMADLLSGIVPGQKLAKELGLTRLGRADEQPSATSAEALKNAQGLAQGLSAPQLAAQRSQAMQAIQASSQGAARRLASVQAAQGMRGGVAVGQQQALQAQNVGARANLERDLLASNFDAMMRGNQQFSTTSAVADQVKSDAQKFNIAQATKEKMMPLTISGGMLNSQYALDSANTMANATTAGSGGGFDIFKALGLK